jgi:hypothetical protein
MYTNLILSNLNDLYNLIYVYQLAFHFTFHQIITQIFSCFFLLLTIHIQAHHTNIYTIYVQPYDSK